jgi:hypothetical protein
MTKKAKKWDPVQSQAAARRRAHFEAGGDTSTWLGRPARFVDRKARKNKKACRGRVKETER